MEQFHVFKAEESNKSFSIENYKGDELLSFKDIKELSKICNNEQA